MQDLQNEKKSILIIDDEEVIQSILFELLNPVHECVLVSSAEEALKVLRQRKFHLVMSDICLSGMSGIEMMPDLQELAPDTVVIMISGMQTVESAIQALRAGVFDYIMKPFDLNQVEVVVDRALEYQDLKVKKKLYEHHLEELVAQRTKELDHTLDSLDKAYRATLKALAAALETRDSETHGHSERVVSFSLRLGRELGLDKETMRSLEFGALLHDIGKIGVPDAILHKPARLTDEEWKKMRLHPVLGKQILRGIGFLEGAAKVVAQHHEKWDGSGYPKGLRGEEIDINARIFSVADTFDAIISNRVYRAGQSYDDACRELDKFSGIQFDPKVVEAFHRVPAFEWDEIREKSLRKRPKKDDPISASQILEPASLTTQR
jgi:putative two-component system response regulator